MTLNPGDLARTINGSLVRLLNTYSWKTNLWRVLHLSEDSEEEPFTFDCLTENLTPVPLSELLPTAGDTVEIRHKGLIYQAEIQESTHPKALRSRHRLLVDYAPSQFSTRMPEYKR